MGREFIRLTGICKSFSSNKVLDNVDLVVNSGEVLCLVGENGCGKSTLIKIISGIYDADNGSIVINGREYKNLNPIDSVREGIQVIYQDFSLFHNLSVAENIAMGIQISGCKKIVNYTQQRLLAKKALDMIGIEMDLEEEVGRLAVAQKQIVAICRAILQDAKLIIMDEPTTALTQKEIERLYRIIDGLTKRDIAVIFVSHKLEEVFTVCQRIAIIRNGCKIIDQTIEEFEKDKLIFYMTGQDIKESPFEYYKLSDEPILQLFNFTQKNHFKDISFSLYKGEILGITGQLGSGRTELAKTLFGIGKADSGFMKLNGKEVRFSSIDDAIENGIAYVPEDRLTEGLFMGRSLIDNINAAIIDKQTKSLGLLQRKEMRQKAIEKIKELKINAKSPDVPASTFSGGNQQRIVLAKWLATNPQILLLNGPTVGVDVKSKSEIHLILKKLASNGFGVIMISDDIDELMSCSNRIMVMNGGKITYCEDTEKIDERFLAQKIIESHDLVKEEAR